MNPTEIFLLVFLFYWLLVMFLDRRGILAKHNITTYGPILMFRTTKGQGFLDRLAVHKRFWRTFANIGLPAMLIGMLAMFILVLFIDYMMLKSFQTQTVPVPGKFNEPRNIFLIPGINEYIPFYWGIIALIITLVVHEFSHAILCKVEGIKVKSMGIIVALVPIGGFAEPDDEQLLGKKEKTEKETPTRKAAEPEKPATQGAPGMPAPGTPDPFYDVLLFIMVFLTVFSGFLGNIPLSLLFAILTLALIVKYMQVISDKYPVLRIIYLFFGSAALALIATIEKNSYILTGLMLLFLLPLFILDRSHEVLKGKIAEPEAQIPAKKIPQLETKKIATRSERVRVLTAGVMANFVTAFVAFVLFFSLLGSISPVGDVMVTSVVPGYPADLAGVKPDMILTGINDKEVNTAHDFIFYANTLQRGNNVTLHLSEKGVRKDINMIATGANKTSAGVGISEIVQGSPAEAAGLQKGMIIVKMDNTDIKELDDFINFMNSTTAGQKVDVYLLSNNSVNSRMEIFRNITLSQYPYQQDVKKGFLGVSYSPDEGAVSYSMGIGIGQFPAATYLNVLKSIPSYMTGIAGWILLFGLPIFGIQGEGFPGFSGVLANFYEPTGWAVPLGIGIFWILNILLWVGWMNFYAGLFNCLPAVPLDGGHVFRDVVASSLTRFMGDGEKVEKVANSIVVLFAVLILISFVFIMIAPFAAHGF
ncbi:MAG: site-2 protease family protein [Candidatus Methanoperedens sp.]|nr:site-2 protease family protein [Candidatus Methanoperedens sp.]